MTDRLSEVLEAAVGEGFLTAAVAREGVRHSEGFLSRGREQPAWMPRSDGLAIDLGTGGGLPGIVLATQTKAHWVLVERSQRRCRFLEWAVRKLELGVRVNVVEADARDLARSDCRGTASLVTARAFGSPSATAEIGAAFLEVGGTLVVSEPPPGEGTDPIQRWPSVGISRLGLVDAGGWHSGSFGYRALSCKALTPDRFPRRETAMASKPVFNTGLPVKSSNL